MKLALLLLFNRRRIGETERLFLDSCMNRDENPTQNEVIESLSSLEKHLLKNQMIVETKGKRGNKVAVIFSQHL